MSSLIKQNKRTEPCVASETWLSDLCTGINSMDNAFYRLLLTGSQEKLRSTYLWTDDYAAFCEIAAKVQWERREGNNKYADLLKQYLLEVHNPYLDEARKEALVGYKRIKDDEFPSNNTQAEKLYQAIQHVLDKLNDCIRPYIDYEMMQDKKVRTKTLRHELLYRMDIKVCPYCNRNMISTLKYQKGDETQGYLPTADLDHLLPKSVFQLFSLSLWNFIPSCKPCNQVMKRDKTCRILPLHDRGFEDDCTFRLDAINREGKGDVASLLGFGEGVNAHWETDPSSKYQDEINSSIRMFRLNEQYEQESGRIRDILRNRYIEGKFHEVVSEYLHEQNNAIQKLTEAEVNRMLYGTSLEPDKFADEPLSKMTFDIIKRN